MPKHINTSARLEKKMSSTAKAMLIALFPNIFNEKEFYLDGGSYKGYRGTVWHQEWHYGWPVDYWGESDSDDCFWLLYSWLIDNTTDFEGMSEAQELANWDADVDLTPFYSPWRGAGRAAIISHCRDLVKAGVTLDRMR